MRNRKMSPDGDFVFGQAGSWLVDSPEAVAQAVRTKLKLYVGEWFLDSREGLDLDAILGYGTHDTRDYEIQQRILSTPGVRGITAYSSSVEGRDFSVNVTLDTIYGTTTIQEAIT